MVVILSPIVLMVVGVPGKTLCLGRQVSRDTPVMESL